MTFSYDSTIGADLDRVRLAIGDTVKNAVQLQDEEIMALLVDEPSYLDASVTAAETLAARYARQVDLTIGPLRQSLSQLQKNYAALADRLRRKLARVGIAPFVGGASIATKIAARENPDLVQPIFRRGMETEPGTDDASTWGNAGLVDPPFPWT